jgi:sporulation protein YlmC with PRC-barrel domain
VRLALGRHLRCADGEIRELADVVIDAGSARVTHLVVQPVDEPDEARLVPIELAFAPPGEPDEVRLRTGGAALDKLDLVRESVYLAPGETPPGDKDWDVGVGEVFVAPSAASEIGDYSEEGVNMSYDRVPKGEIELRHASSVYSADRHHLGRVDGVLVDEDDRVTHLLLERGHLWWKREIAIPAGSVSKFETDVVTLGATKREVEGFYSRQCK